MKMLEIGLGCNMNYRPGASVALHKKLFPQAKLWEAEYDAACVEKHRNDTLKGINLLTGDQGNDNVLDGYGLNNLEESLMWLLTMEVIKTAKFGTVSKTSSQLLSPAGFTSLKICKSRNGKLIELLLQRPVISIPLFLRS